MPGNGRARGVALLVVIWVMTLLAVLLVGFADDARTELLLARNHYEAAAARGIADAGVALALSGILDQSADSQWRADGQQRVFAYGTGSIRVAVQDEAGKLDLNMAPPELLAGLLRALRVGDADAAAVVQAIVDRRQTQSGSGPNTRRRDLPASVRPSPEKAFRTIDELRLLPGMTRALYHRVAPFVTTYSGVADIDPLTAPAEVLRSLPGTNAGEIENFISARERLGPAPGELPPLTSAGGFLMHRALQAATITSEGRTATGTTFTRQVVVSISPDPSAPYAILGWRRALPTAQAGE